MDEPRRCVEREAVSTTPRESARVALVVGSEGGIGGAICEALTADGCVVVGADLAARASSGHPGGYHTLDVRDDESIRRVLDMVIAQHGVLDTVVNCAGVLGSEIDPLTTSTAEFERIMSIHATGTFSLVRESARVMTPQGTGTVLVLSSLSAKEARGDYTPYNAAKLAALHVVWDFAWLLGPQGISVNAVCPGPVNTAMWEQKARDLGGLEKALAAREARCQQIPMRRFAEPQEVASAVAFLTHPKNRYITGVSLDVAGGAHLGMGT